MHAVDLSRTGKNDVGETYGWVEISGELPCHDLAEVLIGTSLLVYCGSFPTWLSIRPSS